MDSHNPLTDEVNKDHAFSAKNVQKKLLGVNTAALVAGVKRYGFRAGGPVQRRDIRGKSRTHIKRLAALGSTRDPNSMVRSSRWEVDDILISSKGFSNLQTFDKQYDEFARRRGLGHQMAFDHLAGRFLDKPKTSSQQINDNIMDSLAQEAVHSR